MKINRPIFLFAEVLCAFRASGFVALARGTHRRCVVSSLACDCVEVEVNYISSFLFKTTACQIIFDTSRYEFIISHDVKIFPLFTHPLRIFLHNLFESHKE